MEQMFTCARVGLNQFTCTRKKKRGVNQITYRKIPIISPGLISVQKAVLLGLFSGDLIFGGAYYWKEICVSKWVAFDDKNSLKHYENSYH